MGLLGDKFTLVIILEMFKELLINDATVTSRQDTTTYEDGISKKDYSETTTPIKCRVSSLNYRDLQLLQ